MKFLSVLVLGMGFFLNSASASLCKLDHNEAQMIGEVKEVLFDLPAPDTPICESTVYLSTLNQHALCPIRGLVEGQTIILNLPAEKELCKYKAGNAVSGVLIERHSDGYLYLEE